MAESVRGVQPHLEASLVKIFFMAFYYTVKLISGHIQFQCINLTNELSELVFWNTI